MQADVMNIQFFDARPRGELTLSRSLLGVLHVSAGGVAGHDVWQEVCARFYCTLGKGGGALLSLYLCARASHVWCVCVCVGDCAQVRLRFLPPAIKNVLAPLAVVAFGATCTAAVAFRPVRMSAAARAAGGYAHWRDFVRPLPSGRAVDGAVDEESEGEEQEEEEEVDRGNDGQPASPAVSVHGVRGEKRSMAFGHVEHRPAAAGKGADAARAAARERWLVLPSREYGLLSVVNCAWCSPDVLLAPHSKLDGAAGGGGRGLQ